MIFDRSSVNGRELVETDDSVEVKGVVLHKPFVEKPLSAEDHNIYIYFPSAYGGGSQRLFRKVCLDVWPGEEQGMRDVWCICDERPELSKTLPNNPQYQCLTNEGCWVRL